MKSNAKPSGRRRFVAARAAIWLVLLAAAGCEQLMPRPDPAPEQPDAADAPSPPPERAEHPESTAQPTRPRLTDAEAAEVARLLDRADRAIEADHLTYPSQGSALALYDRVHILEPDNEEARRGLERIVERYLELATSAADQRRFANARAMLDRARLVDPNHPGIAPTAAQIDMLARADRRVIELDAARLRDHDPVLTATLHQAGLASRGNGCRARITARSDSEGRWIYQQMSEAPGRERIRAQLDIGSPPRVEVLCFPE